MLHLTVKGKTRFLLSVVKINNKYHWTSRRIITFWQQPSLCNSWAPLGFKFPPPRCQLRFHIFVSITELTIKSSKILIHKFLLLSKRTKCKVVYVPLPKTYSSLQRVISWAYTMPTKQNASSLEQASHGFVVCTLCINILCSYWILPCKIPPLCQYSVIGTSKKIIFEEKSKLYVDCNISECKLSLTDAVM